MDSFSTAATNNTKHQSFDYNLLTVPSMDTLTSDTQNKESLVLFEPSTTFTNDLTVASSYYPENTTANNFALTDSLNSNLASFDLNLEINQPFYASTNATTSKNIYNTNYNTHQNSWAFSSDPNYSFQQQDQQKLITMNNVTEFNQVPFANSYDYQARHKAFYDTSFDNWHQPKTTYQNGYNYNQPMHNYNHQTNELQINNSSLSSTPTSSSSTSSPNNKDLIQNELSQLKSEPIIMPADNFNLLTQFKKEIKTESVQQMPYQDNTLMNKIYFKNEPDTLKSIDTKPKMNVYPETKTLYSVVPCSVCEKPSSGNNFGAEICEACKGFFRRFSRKNNVNRPPTCDQNCNINRENRSNCSPCRYEKCLAVGMSIENVYYDKTRLDDIKTVKTEIDDDLNLNSNSINEIRNLSIEVVLSSTSNSLSSSSSSTTSSSNSSNLVLTDQINHSDLIKLLLKEVNFKKSQIRLERNEQKIKYHLAELSEKVSNCLLINLKKTNTICTNDSFLALISNRTKSFVNDFKNSNKQLLIAYQCLIDDTTNSFSFSSPFELRIKSLLTKIYSNLNYNLLKSVKSKNKKSVKPLLKSTNTLQDKQIVNNDFNLFDSSNNNNINNQFVDCSVNPYDTYYPNNQNIYPNYNPISLTSNYSNLTVEELQSHKFELNNQNNYLNIVTELKLLHFLLLLFSSFQSLEEFIQSDSDLLGKNNNNNKNKINFNTANDIAFCQKFIIKLIDRLCDDKSVRTQILLSVSEIEFF